MVRAVVLVLLVGCGFRTGGAGSDGPADAPPIDGRIVDAPVIVPIDGPSDPPIDAPAAHNCGAGYVTVPGSGTQSTYRKVNNGATWDAARTDCQGDTAYLVIPETMAEAVAVYGFVAPASVSPFYWAGISDFNDDGTWITVLNATFPNPPWAPQQPSNKNNEDTVLVGSNGRFYDYFPDAAQEYACECAP